MIPVLVRASLRYLARHRWQSGLSVLGIALGVAVVIAVDIANESARRAFDLSIERVAGRATHRIESASGGIPDAVYADLRRHGGLAAIDASPIIEAPVRIADATFTLIGLDLLAFSSVRGTGLSVEGPSLKRILTQPDTLLLSASDARRLGVVPGDTLPLRIGARELSAELVGILTSNQTSGFEGLAIADIATAQEITERVGTIDRIDLVITPEEASALAEALPPGLRLVASEQRSETLRQMTRAFHTNLTAMSLLAMLVGGFIIYNTMTFAVLQRRSLLGSLRTLGCTRAQLFTLVLSEALFFALVGALLGLTLGVLTGWGLVQLVTRTINDIYFALTVRELFVTPLSVVKGMTAGLLITLVAALGPAIEAARAQPRDVLRANSLERRGQRWVLWLGAFGLTLMVVGWGAAQIPSRSIGLGFLAILILILGFSLCVPAVLRAIALGLARIVGPIGGIPAVLAARGVAASITRTGIAAAALTVAISSTLGVGVMIDSFRSSLIVWLDTTLQSDIYVSAPSETGNRADGVLPSGLAERLAGLPGIAEISMGRSVRVESETGSVLLLGLTSSSVSPSGFSFDGGEAADLWTRFETGELILASEPYAYHHDVGVGDRVELFTQRGWQSFEIGGIFRDYGSDAGMLIMSGGRYATLWADDAVSSIGIMVHDNADRAEVFERIRALTETFDAPVLVSLNEQIREQSLDIFDRTFAITHVLRLLAIGVAFIGVLSALMALELERRRDYAVMRATGITRRELTLLILTQTSILGLSAGVLAIPLGLVMADLLIEVVNLRSFGWTMEMRIPSLTLIQDVVLAWSAALLAGLYPAYRSARTDPAQALRSE
ncbi:FtsX-like permease family protein [Thiocapsa bogorovii]|uniref:FtsX-like permease family protein n=1 Tax=Thiocapsa bogorovii TaxID=521689 RepID=UPI001E412EFC|nr:FtsX-like permease family protein [Thiocapsa bogorovii]UHD15954.1 FtsX-like permease family protein [Thiocapsa bogorovii]